jgi:hypothetical protein
LGEKSWLENNFYPGFVPTVQHWVANEQGSKSFVAVQKRVRPWWHEDGTGEVA